jgi:hypothetical protein
MWQLHRVWWPVQTIGGRTVWPFQMVQRRWNPKLYFRAIWMDDPGDYEGGWEYRLPAA